VSHGVAAGSPYGRQARRRQSWYFRPSDQEPAGGVEAPAQGKADSAAAMTQEEESELRAQLARLRQEHRDLDAAIEALQVAPGADILQIQRLKKRKLVLRDRIAFIEDQLTPDIIA
jgi:hypothetical protein